MGDQQLSQPESSEGAGLLFFQHQQGQCGPLPGLHGSLSHGLEGVPESDSPTSPCFDPDPGDSARLELGGHKGMELTGNADWGHSDMGGQVNVKQEPGVPRLASAVSGYTYCLPFDQCEDQLAKRTDVKLDSFNEAFANRHSLVHGSGVMGNYPQNMTLRQMLSEKPPAHRYPHPRVPQHLPCVPVSPQPKVMLQQSLHYSYPQLLRLSELQQHQQQLPAITQQMAQDILEQAAVPMQQQQLHKPSAEAKQQSDGQHQAGHYHQMQQPSHHHLLQHMQMAQICRDPAQRTAGQHQCQPGKFEQLHHPLNAPPQYLYGERQHYRVQGQQRDTLTHQLYQQPTHSSPVQSPQQLNTSPSVLYSRSCSRQELENGEHSGCAELHSPLSAVVSKEVASQACPSGLYWQQVHPGPQACARMPEQRRGMEEKPDASYSFSCGYCKEQFRSLSALHIHTGTNGCLRTPHIVSQNDVEKAPRDCSQLSPSFTATSMSVKSDQCRQDALLEENPGSFLAEQDIPALTTMADFPAQESSQSLVPEYYPVTVYQSCLRSAGTAEGQQLSSSAPSLESPHYTPLPMLNPNRKASGLFSNLSAIDPSSNSTPSPFPCTRFNGFEFDQQDSATSRNIPAPCINIGPRFQATVPDLVDTIPGGQDPHEAGLVWSPWKELVENEEVQQKVEDLLNLACSSALPGGGLNREFTLHCLSELNGDIMAALEVLLLNNGARCTSHPLADYHYTGSSNWSPSERRVFNKAFGTHRKDFHMIQKMVRSKLVAECVEYYYNFKKSLKFNKKHRHRPSDTDEDWNNVFRQDVDCEQAFPSLQAVQPSHRGDPCPSVIGNFPCKQCGKMFYKIKSRNAHMKIHRQQDDWQHRAHDALYPPVTYTGATLAKPVAAPVPAYASWENREIQEQLEAMSEAMTCTSLPPLYHQDAKVHLAKEKCQNIFLQPAREGERNGRRQFFAKH
ncbi:transcriptional-regulating factor 1-like isoform X1 [Scyliorhinus canicula]|uniref:transcriptional-regulating factor 1-like isoform X1 n=1 Tax=Scyliorhinus canicula TaxID=7830 RepID=UPI0018F71F77|nr:transcriptional-regulating factor 1-like isoform X1 [Scyliorhinus canicula]XP_038643425.1 transcriptional-regulating factor 1-like isoform X1 [Scyliorhinus canicula]